MCFLSTLNSNQLHLYHLKENSIRRKVFENLKQLTRTPRTKAIHFEKQYSIMFLNTNSGAGCLGLSADPAIC